MTLATLLLSAGIALSPESECLSTIIYREARGESYTGMVAVGIVARNRVLDERFPDTLCDVMTQPNQFSFVNSGLHLSNPSEKDRWEYAQQAASDVMDMQISLYRPMDNALYFHSLNKCPRSWRNFELVSVIGGHKFYSDNS